MEKYIEIFDNMFNSPSKHDSLKKPKVVYRALQSQLSNEQNAAIIKSSGIFDEQSFISTSPNLDVAKRFWHKNPIMEITLPEKTPYLKLDELFNIDGQHWREEEFLLPRNSRFLITGRDWEKNIIKAQFLLD